MEGDRHRPKSTVSQAHRPSDETEGNNNDNGSSSNNGSTSNTGNGTKIKKRKGWIRTQLKRPPNGTHIPIGEAGAHRLMLEFWSIYKLVDDSPAQTIEADRILENSTQNRGGSRSFVQTQSMLEKQHGYAAATNMNTYKCMKGGVKNCTKSGKVNPSTTLRSTNVLTPTTQL